jgi:hypothetical protein
VWPICHRVIVVANFCQSLASYFFATLFVAATLLWLATLWLGKMWPGTKQALNFPKTSQFPTVFEQYFGNFSNQQST